MGSRASEVTLLSTKTKKIKTAADESKKKAAMKSISRR